MGWDDTTYYTDDPLIQNPLLCLGVIVFDTESGVTNTVWPYGTFGYPVNNIDDAVVLADDYQVRKILVLRRGSASTAFGAGVSDIMFEGVGGEFHASSALTFDLNSKSINRCRFIRLAITGTEVGGYNRFERCYLFDTSLKEGNVILRCIVGGTHANGGRSYLFACAFQEATLNLNHADGYSINIMGGSGKITFSNNTGLGQVVKMWGFDGEVVVDSSCVAGSITIYGSKTRLTNNTGGTTVTFAALDPSKSYLTGTANSDGDIEQNESTGDFNATQIANFTAMGNSISNVLQNLSTVDGVVDAIKLDTTAALLALNSLDTDLSTHMTALNSFDTDTTANFKTLMNEMRKKNKGKIV